MTIYKVNEKNYYKFAEIKKKVKNNYFKMIKEKVVISASKLMNGFKQLPMIKYEEGMSNEICDYIERQTYIYTNHEKIRNSPIYDSDDDEYDCVNKFYSDKNVEYYEMMEECEEAIKEANEKIRYLYWKKVNNEHVFDLLVIKTLEYNLYSYLVFDLGFIPWGEYQEK